MSMAKRQPTSSRLHPSPPAPPGASRSSPSSAPKDSIPSPRAFPKIDWLLNSAIEEIIGEPGKTGVTGARIKNLKTGAVEQITCNGVFVAIGHQPNTDLFKGQLDMDENGYLVLPGTKSAQTSTKIPGVFAAGDVADHVYRQAVTAAGTGCQAAIDAERFLSH